MKIKIIGGQNKGQWLHTFPKNLPIRPMTQRVKKSVFDTIAHHFQQKNEVRILDLFSGCGNLSLEALSRGATFSHAVDRHRGCTQVIKNNAIKLCLEDKITIYQQDVFLYLKKFKESLPYHIIFIDPPFSSFLSVPLINSLKISSVCDNKTLIVLEISSKEKWVEDNDILLQSKKSYGDKCVYFFNILKKAKDH